MPAGARRDSSRWRFYCLAAAVILPAVFFWYRLFQIQIVAGEAYRARAESQYISVSGTRRGSIFFRDKNGELVSAAINRPDGSGKRFYPGGSLAAHALGFLGWMGDTYTGLYGLERFYNHLLVLSPGRSASLTALLDFWFGQSAGTQPSTGAHPNHTTSDLVVTIEPTVTRRLQSMVEELQTKWQAKAVGGLVVEPKSGSIIGWGVTPTYNPGSSVEDLSLLTNPLVEHVYEFGSIFKPLTLAAALDAGVISSETTYFDSGEITIDGQTIRNYDGQSRGMVNMQTVLNQSLNTGAVFAAQALGAGRFRDYLTKFGVGERTGIDLPNESSGLTSNLDSGLAIEHATAAFGQGIALTPIQMVRALSVLANNGVRPNLHLGEAILDSGQEKKLISFSASEPVISSAAAATITQMLVRTVDEALAGGQAKLPHYQVAAKTGTAQMPATDGSGYDPRRYLHSFFDYFPASSPRFLVFLYLVEPQGASYASETLTAAALDLTKFLLDYYDVPPDR